MIKTLLSTIAVVISFIQTAIPLGNFAYYMEQKSEGSIYPYYNTYDSPPIVTYTKTATTTDNTFDWGTITINKTIKNAINDSTSPLPTYTMEETTEPITRQLPINNKNIIMNSDRAVKYHINEYYMVNTAQWHTAVCIPLNTGPYNTTNITINSWPIKNSYFDFYCEMEGDDVRSRFSGITTQSGMHAVLLAETLSLYQISGSINLALSKQNCIELNIETISENRISISGLIPNNAAFYQKWNSSTSRLYLIVWNTNLDTFGAQGLGEGLDVYFPSYNANKWSPLIVANQPVKINTNDMSNSSTISDAFITYVNNATNFFGTMIDGMAFYGQGIGYIMSFMPLLYIIIIAYLIEIFRRMSE